MRWPSLRRLFTPGSYEPDYFRSLAAEYQGQRPLTDQELEARLDALRAMNTPTPHDICELELLTIRSESDELVRLKLSLLRARFVEVVGQPPPSAPAGANIAPASVKDEAMFLTAEIHRGHVLNQHFEAMRGGMVRFMGVVALVFVIALIARLLWRPVTGAPAIVLVAGVLGGLTSALRRVYTMNRTTDVVTSIQSLSASTTSLMAAPLLGAIFSMVFWFLVLGHLIGGDAFPQFTVLPADGQALPSDKAIPFLTFFYGQVQATVTDYAKLILWGFLAGFAERLVPDVLDTVSTRARAINQ